MSYYNPRYTGAPVSAPAPYMEPSSKGGSGKKIFGALILIVAFVTIAGVVGAGVYLSTRPKPKPKPDTETS